MLFLLPETAAALSEPCPLQSFMSRFNYEIAPNNLSRNAFPDKPDLQYRKPKNSSRTSNFLSTKLRMSDICSLFDVSDASSAITE